MPGQCYLAVVRSPVAHAVLHGVDLEAARRAPGVVAAVAAADIAGVVRPLPINPAEGARLAAAPHPILATDRVRYVGQPVAGVLAETRAAAEDAAGLIVLAYDSLPAVVDTKQAQRGDVLLHDHLPDNRLLEWRRTGGDVEGAFAGARIIRGTFHIPRLAAAPMEARGALAVWDPGTDRLTLWLSAQDPHRPRAQVGRVFDLPEDRVRVIIPDVGGAFGSKGHLPPESAVAAALARITGRPVKWIEERRENLVASYQGRGLDAEVELAVDGDGRILGLRARLAADLGAYLFPATAIPSISTAMLLTGTYAVAAADVELVGLATNKVPVGPYRGAGRPEAAYLIERMVDLAARELHLDPLELRRRNLIGRDRFPYQNPLGFTYDSGDYPAALDRAAALIDYTGARAAQEEARRAGRSIGVGVAMYVERAASAVWESASITVEPDGRAVVRTGSTAHGQGHETMFAQIAGDALGLDLDEVTVRQGDSAEVPRGVGTFGSRSTTIGGSAVVVAAERIRSKATRIAAHLLEAAADDIVWEDGALFVRGAPARRLSFRDVAAAAYQPVRLPPDVEVGLQATATFTLPRPVFPSGAYAAVAEVDPETGQVWVRRLVAVDDAGRIVNPLLAEGQVIGAAAQGLGQALCEAVQWDEAGQPLTATFTEYAMPRAAWLPEIASALMETPSPLNPLGAKGIGEAGTSGAPAAVANAVLDALAPFGIRHLDLPLTPPKIWSALRGRMEGETA